MALNDEDCLLSHASDSQMGEGLELRTLTDDDALNDEDWVTPSDSRSQDSIAPSKKQALVLCLLLAGQGLALHTYYSSANLAGESVQLQQLLRQQNSSLPCLHGAELTVAKPSNRIVAKPHPSEAWFFSSPDASSDSGAFCPRITVSSKPNERVSPKSPGWGRVVRAAKRPPLGMIDHAGQDQDRDSVRFVLAVIASPEIGSKSGDRFGTSWRTWLQEYRNGRFPDMRVLVFTQLPHCYLECVLRNKHEQVCSNAYACDDRFPGSEDSDQRFSPLAAHGQVSFRDTNAACAQFLTRNGYHDGLCCKSSYLMEEAHREYPAADWVIRVTDDAFVFLDNLRYQLSAFEPSHKHAVGLVAQMRITSHLSHDVLNDEGVMVHDDPEPNRLSVPHLSGGPGWAYSQGLLEHLALTNGLRDISRVCVRDDLDYGEFLTSHGVNLRNLPGIISGPPEQFEGAQRGVTSVAELPECTMPLQQTPAFFQYPDGWFVNPRYAIRWRQMVAVHMHMPMEHWDFFHHIEHDITTNGLDPNRIWVYVSAEEPKVFKTCVDALPPVPPPTSLNFQNRTALEASKEVYTFEEAT